MTFSTPDLPETFESKEDDLLAMLDEEETPAAQAEEVTLPDWLKTPDTPVAPETTPEPSEPEATSEPAALAPQKHEEDDLIDLLDLEEEVTTKEPEPDLLEIHDEPAIPEIPEPVAQKPKAQEEDDLLDLLDLEEEEAPAVATAQPVATPPAEEEDLFDLLDIDEKDETATPTPQTSATPPPLDDLIALKEEESIPDKGASLSLKGTPSVTQSAVPTETSRIENDAPLGDYQANAEMIGITPDEYLGFLRQFTDESLQYEAGLKSNDLYIFKKNLISIKDASQLLHLPQLSETLNRLEGSTSEEREQLISNFYGMIQHIRRDLDRDTQSTPQSKPAPEPQTPSPQAPSVPTPPTPAELSPSFDAIKPIPFDFSTKAASDELGLPESLVQEFVADFVQQAKENIPVFEEAQRTGDIDTIQKTAHLLKGAASNLRIDPLAETLKSLQYNEAPEAVPELFQTFFGQLKTLVQFTEN